MTPPHPNSSPTLPRKHLLYKQHWCCEKRRTPSGRRSRWPGRLPRQCSRAVDGWPHAGGGARAPPGAGPGDRRRGRGRSARPARGPPAPRRAGRRRRGEPRRPRAAVSAAAAARPSSSCSPSRAGPASGTPTTTWPWPRCGSSPSTAGRRRSSDSPRAGSSELLATAAASRGGRRPGRAGRGARRRAHREGYAASGATPGAGVQLCQHHCPVAHVAAEFPQLCEAETAAFAELLGTHVQRLATIAHGDAVCTTHVPRMFIRTRHPEREAVRMTTAPEPPHPGGDARDARPLRLRLGRHRRRRCHRTRGLNEDVVRDISAKKNEPQWMLELRLKALRPVRAQADADLGRRPVRHRLRQHQVLRPLDREAGRDLGRPARRHQEHLRPAGHPGGGEAAPGRRRRRAVRVRGRLPPDPRGPRGAGRHLPGHRHRAARAPGALRGVLRLGHPGRRQQVLRAEHRGVVGRLVHLRAAGRARRHPAAGLLPDQHREHGPVRAHADHRRRGRLRALRRGLHRADLQVRLAALRGRRDHRQEGRPLPLHDHPELVEQRLQPGHQAGQGRGRRDHGVGRRQHRLQGDDEVPVGVADGRARQGRGALDRVRRRGPAPGRRREDAAPRAAHVLDDHLQVGGARRRPHLLPRPGAGQPAARTTRGRR